MFNGKEFKEGKFIYSKDEYCYREVVEDFENASQIGIMTYNISKKADDYLIKQLREVKETTDIQIVTNIPGRYDTYYKSRGGSDVYKETAKNTIKVYLRKLDPKNYNAKIETYFNFDNHMKVIVTNNIAYWGSANYSEESKNNYEVGTITTDKEFIKYLFSEFFPEIREASVPYYDEDYYELRLSLIRLINISTSFKTLLEDSFLIELPNGKFGFKGGETFFSEDDLSEMVYILDELSSIGTLIENIDYEALDMEEEIDNIMEQYESIETSVIRDAIENDDFYEYISATHQDLFDDIFNEYASVAYDEYLNGYVEKANDEARDIIDSRAEAVSNDTLAMIDEFGKLLERLIELRDKLDEFSHLVISDNIDNT